MTKKALLNISLGFALVATPAAALAFTPQDASMPRTDGKMDGKTDGKMDGKMKKDKKKKTDKTNGKMGGKMDKQ